MAVMSWPRRNMEKLLKKLVANFPELTFIEGSRCRWSPHDKTITYAIDDTEDQTAWALFHELAHASLNHTTYSTDLELLLMESSAWDKAKQLAAEYGLVIDEDHIQDCLDTYRDWLDQRSTCPVCGNNSLQQGSEEYRCFNCRTVWRVSSSRFCRPYRQRNRSKKKTPPSITAQITFN